MGKSFGFPVLRKRLSRPRLALLPRWFLFLALAALLLIAGVMRSWSQSSEPKLSSSNEILEKWEKISERFQNELNALRQDLQLALNDAEQSKTYSGKLTNLYEISLRRIENLERYNGQIAERMQDRDEDLALAYDRIDQLEKKRFKFIIVILVEGIVITIFAGIIIYLLKMRKIKS